ncbi:MAG TPA: NADH-quinone oxidoreductase subunit N [Longimicrobium sp.]|jgi:NADH-quinone oxidoreductase subunit N|uniref:NADH-quinone oxidoreductase subunit N n=1 Tax=Longimicrobium sp. TaxID=2029185 RepID=UPI002ED8F4CF
MPNELNLLNQAQYFWALLPEIVLALGAMLVLMVDVFEKGNKSRASSPMIPILSLGVLVVTALTNILLYPMRDVSGVGMVALDNFRVIVNFICLLAAGLAILLSVGYLDRRGINRGEFHALVLFSTLGMMLMAGAADLLMVFIGLEVMSVAIYVLVGFDRMDARSSEASLKYFLLGAFSSAFFLYGIALTFGATGTTNIAALRRLLLAGGHAEPMLLAGMALTMVGFGFKVAAMPFHMWTPDAYDGAPTPVTALMSTGVKAAAFASFIRVFLVGFSGQYEHWARPVFFLAVLTMVGGNLIAATQGSVKRMLAYSSIAHAGYLLSCLLAINTGGPGAFLFYLLVYTLMTAGAFGIVTAMGRGTDDRAALDDFAGLGHQKPVLAALFSIFLLSLAGFPLTAGFLGKLYILNALVRGNIAPLAVVLVLASLVSYFYYLRVIVVMYMRPARTAEEHRDSRLPAPAMAGVSLAAVLVVLLFFISGIRFFDGGQPGHDDDWGVLDLAERGAATLFAETPVPAQAAAR